MVPYISNALLANENTIFNAVQGDITETITGNET